MGQHCNHPNIMRTHLFSLFLLWLGMLGGAGLAFLTQLLLVRTVSVVDVGVIAGVMSLMLLAMPLVEFGIAGLWLRQFGKDGTSAFSWVKPSLQIVMVLSLAVSAVVSITGLAVWDNPQQHQLLFLLLILPLMETAVVLVGSRMQLEGRYRVLSLWRAVPKFARFIVALVAWLAGLDLLFIAMGYCFVSLLILIVAAIQLLPMMHGKIKLEKQTIVKTISPAKKKLARLKCRPQLPKVISQAWPFAMGGFFSLIYLQSDIFMLSALYDAQSTALYSVAFSTIGLIYLLPTAIFNQFLLPKYHRWAEYDRDRLLQAYRLGNGYMVILGILVFFTLFLTAPYLIELLFGSRYAESGKVVQLLSLCVPFRYLASSIGNCLVTQNHMRHKMKYQMVVAIFNVSLNLALIPGYGMYGAGLATVISEILLCALYLMGVWKHIFGPDAVRGWSLNLRLLAQ